MEADFVKENELYNVVEGKPLDIEIPKLRNKYNNLKKQWRTAVDRQAPDIVCILRSSTYMCVCVHLTPPQPPLKQTEIRCISILKTPQACVHLKPPQAAYAPPCTLDIVMIFLGP